MSGDTYKRLINEIKLIEIVNSINGGHMPRLKVCWA